MYNRNGRLNKRGEGLVSIQCRLDRKSIYFKTNVYLLKVQFEKGYVVNHPNANKLNEYLLKLKHEIESVELQILNEKNTISLNALKTAVNEHYSEDVTIREFGEKMVEESDRSILTKQNYKTLFNSLDKFRKNSSLIDIDYNFIVSYEKHLNNNGLEHNTIISRMRMLKAIVAEAIRLKVIQDNPFDKYKVKPMKPKKGYLTEENIQQVEELKVEGRDEIIRDAFLLACYTGLRFSDIITLKREHIKDGWIRKEMVKTKMRVDIPYHLFAKNKIDNIITKYKGNIEKLTNNIPTNSTVNKILKGYFKELGVSDKFTFHTSRHTFATLLAKSGLPLQMVQKLLGHTKLETTLIYSETNSNDFAKELSKYF